MFSQKSSIDDRVLKNVHSCGNWYNWHYFDMHACWLFFVETLQISCHWKYDESILVGNFVLVRHESVLLQLQFYQLQVFWGNVPRILQRNYKFLFGWNSFVFKWCYSRSFILSQRIVLNSSVYFPLWSLVSIWSLKGGASFSLILCTRSMFFRFDLVKLPLFLHFCTQSLHKLSYFY